MTKYHINPRTGNPGVCRASIQQCPLGGDSSHFKTKEEARADYEETQKLAAIIPSSPTESLDVLERDVNRGVELLKSEVETDGTPLGSSQQSRAKKAFQQARYVSKAYITDDKDWEERRGYYDQVTTSLRALNRELGKNSWGGPKKALVPLVERIDKMMNDFHELSGPEGRKKEAELGYFK